MEIAQPATGTASVSFKASIFSLVLALHDTLLLLVSAILDYGYVRGHITFHQGHSPAAQLNTSPFIIIHHHSLPSTLASMVVWVL